MNISIIAAMDENRIIGGNNTIPWHIPSDMRRFKEKTLDHPVVMGRLTWDSIPVKYQPLPNRTNIVLSRKKIILPEGCILVSSVGEAILAACECIGGEEIMVIGGGQIYKEFLPLATKIYLTTVKTKTKGDTKFPEFDLSDWKEISSEEVFEPKDEYPTVFSTFESTRM